MRNARRQRQYLLWVLINRDFSSSSALPFLLRNRSFFFFAFPFSRWKISSPKIEEYVRVCSRGRELVSTSENGITDIEMMGNAKRKEVGLVVREEQEGYYFVAVGGGGGEH